MKIFSNKKYYNPSINNSENIKTVYSQIKSNYAERYMGLSGKYYEGTEMYSATESVDFFNKKVLDIGTGTGRFIDFILDKANLVVGIDISKGMVDYCVRKFSGQDRITIKQMDGLNLEFEDNTFDIVLNFGYENTTNLLPYLREVNRVLKKDGVFIFSCLNDTTLFNIYDAIAIKMLNIYKDFPRIKFSKGEMQISLEKSGFKAIKVASNFCLIPPYLLPFKRFEQLNKILPICSFFINLLIYLNKICSCNDKLGYELIFHAKKR